MQARKSEMIRENNVKLGRQQARAAVLALFILSGLLLGTLMASPAQAQQATPVPVTDDQVNAIAREMYCPVCENTPLDVCPTQACAEWRELIRLKLSEGWTEKQIKDYFVQQYGDRVLATPPPRGLNWLIYIIPPLAFLAGAWVLFRAFRAWQRPLTAVLPPEEQLKAAVDDDYIQRLEAELQERKE